MNLNELDIYHQFIQSCQDLGPGASPTMAIGIVVLMIRWTADISSMVGSELQQQVRNFIFLL